MLDATSHAGSSRSGPLLSAVSISKRYGDFLANDGIDLAVRERTPVRAADNGVVAYAGNDLKGYGNLVLVCHSLCQCERVDGEAQ